MITLEQQLEDIKARYYPLERARNDFFYFLLHSDNPNEDHIKKFEEIFHVKRENLLGSTVTNMPPQRWDELLKK